MVDVDLSDKDYERILKWFFLAFAKLPSEMIENDDKKLKLKLEIMKEAETLIDGEGD
jgi:hypothetical protein